MCSHADWTVSIIMYIDYNMYIDYEHLYRVRQQQP